MSWKCYQPRKLAEHSSICAICGKKFYAKTNHKSICDRCKRVIGKHRRIKTKEWRVK